MRIQQTIEHEQRVPKFIPVKGGYEFTTNASDIKILLRHTRFFASAIEQEYYSASYYIFEGTNWLKTNEEKPYTSLEEFIREISHVTEFSEAIDDYEVFSKV